MPRKKSYNDIIRQAGSLVNRTMERAYYARALGNNAESDRQNARLNKIREISSRYKRNIEQRTWGGRRYDNDIVKQPQRVYMGLAAG